MMAPDFHYVATHICNSLKRQLKQEDHGGVQGEFGIGLAGGRAHAGIGGIGWRNYEMRMRRGDPRYSANGRRQLFVSHGIEVTIRPLLPGIRHFSGEKIQWYLAADRLLKRMVELSLYTEEHLR